MKRHSNDEARNTHLVIGRKHEPPPPGHRSDDTFSILGDSINNPQQLEMRKHLVSTQLAEKRANVATYQFAISAQEVALQAQKTVLLAQQSALEGQTKELESCEGKLWYIEDLLAANVLCAGKETEIQPDVDGKGRLWMFR